MITVPVPPTTVSPLNSERVRGWRKQRCPRAWPGVWIACSDQSPTPGTSGIQSPSPSTRSTGTCRAVSACAATRTFG